MLELAVFLLIAAQSLSGDDIARQLDARDPRTTAWGAYNAGAYHREDMIPRLQRILETPPSILDAREEYAFVSVVLDTLIQLDARVSAPLLGSYVDRFPVHTFVLLSNATDRENLMTQLLPRLSGFQWFAAADMLFDDRSPALIDHLAGTVRLHLTVVVADSDTVAVGAGSVSGGVACGIGQTAPGYPPHAEYRFEGERPGFHVLAVGPHPVYYSRTVSRTLQYPVSQSSISGPDDEDRLAFLRAMAPDNAASFRAETVATVRWTNPAALAVRVQQLRSELSARLNHVVERAGQSRQRPTGVVMDIPVDVRLIDQRRDKRIPLPDIGR